MPGEVLLSGGYGEVRLSFWGGYGEWCDSRRTGSGTGGLQMSPVSVSAAQVVRSALVLLLLIAGIIFVIPDRENLPPPDPADSQAFGTVDLPPVLAEEFASAEQAPSAPVATLHGIVVDPMDRPIPGACVGWDEDHIAARAPGTMLTGADGRFHIERIKPPGHEALGTIVDSGGSPIEGV